MKTKLFLLLLIPFISLSQSKSIKKVKGKIPTKKTIASVVPKTVNATDIANGLKEALNKGIDKQVSKLTAVDGFYKNELVKILMPEELQKVDRTLRKIGLSALADEGIVMLNRAAEDAVKQSTPIFIDAVKNINFNDAKSILLGNENAATTYLQVSTTKALYDKFSPVIKTSLNTVGADKVWANIISKYNAIPLVSKVNPDLTDYTTNKALDGVFKMIAVEEKLIRTDLGGRSTKLLEQVFALQDKK
jgi:hypothetical protein